MGSFLPTIFSCLSAFFLAVLFGCTSNRTQRTAQAELRLDRGLILELHEAFKNTSGEKTVALGELGELTCSGRICRLPVMGKAEIYEKAQVVGQASVKGLMLFDVETTRHLLDLVEEARGYQKDKADSGKIGAVVCTKQGCLLTFSFQRDQEIAASDLVTPPSERPVRKQRSDYAP